MSPAPAQKNEPSPEVAALAHELVLDRWTQSGVSEQQLAARLDRAFAQALAQPPIDGKDGT